MKQKIFKFSFLLGLALIFSGLSNAQDRNVLWLHGLGENGATWDIYEGIFDAARQINGVSPGYNSFNGLNNAALANINRFGSAGNPANTAAQNIGIGHSMGGVVLREIDRTYTGANQRFGGIITIGTPNKGTRIVNSIQNGAVNAVLDDACNRLAAGPVSMLPFLAWNIGGFVPSTFCPIIREEALERMFGPDLLDAFGQSAIDLAQGSGALATLNAHNSTIPRISIWGNEQSPTHWRLISSMRSNNQNDVDIMDVANRIQILYSTMRDMKIAQAFAAGILASVWPPSAIAAALFAHQAMQWGRGAVWIETSETTWNAVIGCNQNQSYTYTAVASTAPGCNLSTLGSLNAYIQCLLQCAASNCFVPVTYTVTVPINKKSDGFICAGSQIMDGLPQQNIYEARWVNHNEETNTTISRPGGNDVVRDVFNSIWDRPFSGDFFITPVR